MRTLRKLAAILFLFVLLAPLAASAAGSKPKSIHKPAKAPASLLSRVWALASGIWIKEGLGIDPHGSPAPAPGSGSPTNEGIGIDPSGSSGV